MPLRPMSARSRKSMPLIAAISSMSWLRLESSTVLPRHATEIHAAMRIYEAWITGKRRLSPRASRLFGSAPHSGQLDNLRVSSNHTRRPWG
jgi:hypothetical protein